MKPRHRGILRRLLSAPTAPFLEEAVAGELFGWAGRGGVDFARDAYGNVVLRYRRGRRRRRTGWVFAAHMDHPGFVVTRSAGRRVWADFRGGVRREYFKGARVRLFASAGEAVATVTSLRAIAETPWFACRLTLDRPAEVPPGTIGMWDLPAIRIRGRRLASRACDDVVGTAAVVCALDELAARGLDADVTGLLTRAEEAAFIGALAACRDRLLPDGAAVVAIETSKATGAAPLGGGVVVRVGDRMRTFDPSLTAHVCAIAAGLARRDRRFRHTRQLMSGGTCESTVYAAYGYPATGLAVPLANYHNQGPGGRIAPERVDLDDFASLVKLLVALAESPATPADTDAALKKRLKRLFQTRGRYL